MKLIPVAVLSAACFGQISHVAISEPTSIPGAVLQPGRYVFSVVDGLPDRKIVRVAEGDKPVSLFVMAPNARIRRNDETLLFWPGRNRALRAWFIPGESIAAEAVYGKQEALDLARRTGHPVPAIDPESQLRIAADARLSQQDLTILELWALDYGPLSAENRELTAAKLQTVAWRPAVETLPRTAGRHGSALIWGLGLVGAGVLLRKAACVPR